jgi:Transglycosylase SLT domain
MPHSSYLGFDPHAELPLDKKPAEIVLDSLRNIPVGTPVEEIKRAAEAFGLDFSFMEAVAKIESDFDPKQRTGSYIGLFQLSRSEFRKYGSGDITSPRDNAVAAAYKLVTEAMLFELYTHREPTVSDLYLIHQQGWRGAAEHISHPERIAWQSMCATDEGRQKGERWCKRAIWGNTLPTVKHVWKSVNKLTSDAFVNMWRQRVDQLYSRYSETAMAANEDR